MKELIKYALPGGCVQRDTRDLKRANDKLKKKTKAYNNREFLLCRLRAKEHIL